MRHLGNLRFGYGLRMKVYWGMGQAVGVLLGNVLWHCGLSSSEAQHLMSSPLK